MTGVRVASSGWCGSGSHSLAKLVGGGQQPLVWVRKHVIDCSVETGRALTHLHSPSAALEALAALAGVNSSLEMYLLRMSSMIRGCSTGADHKFICCGHALSKCQVWQYLSKCLVRQCLSKCQVWQCLPQCQAWQYLSQCKAWQCLPQCHTWH